MSLLERSQDAKAGSAASEASMEGTLLRRHLSEVSCGQTGALMVPAWQQQQGLLLHALVF